MEEPVAFVYCFRRQSQEGIVAQGRVRFALSLYDLIQPLVFHVCYYLMSGSAAPECGYEGQQAVCGDAVQPCRGAGTYAAGHYATRLGATAGDAYCHYSWLIAVSAAQPTETHQLHCITKREGGFHAI